MIGDERHIFGAALGAAARTLWLSHGERRLLAAYAVVFAFGAGIGFIAISRLSQAVVPGADLTNYHLWIILCSGIGAAAAMALAGDRIGGAGPLGLMRALWGMVWITVVGAVIAGTMALPGYGTMFGPFTVGVMLVSSPILALLWFANLLAAHLMIAVWRAEQVRPYAKMMAAAPKAPPPKSINP